ncbi:MAG: hypothetical protein JO232_05675 [Verrucomicrobia bacterium]|nr:hypothetical protein [Verrucomicrobiota bacterium]
MRTIANRSRTENLVGIRKSALRDRGHSATPTATEDVIRRFNRDTQLLAAEVVVALVLVMLVLGVVVRERRPEATGLAEQESQTSRDLLVSATAHASAKEGSTDRNSFMGETTTASTVSAGPVTAEILPWPESASIGGGTSESARTTLSAVVLKVKHRLSARLRFGDVKARLIALWHQSLARSQEPQTWTGALDSAKRQRKRIVYSHQNEQLMQRWKRKHHFVKPSFKPAELAVAHLSFF